MGQSYFVWKGIDCRSLGVKLSAPVTIVRPEERVQHIEIPGRSGDLTLLEGEGIYNSYIQTASILVKGGMRIREIYDWLRGSGYVTFSGEPDRKQSARIIGAVTLEKQSRNLDWYAGDVQFYCHPLKELLSDDPVTITSSGATVYNRGDVIALPKITAVSTGAPKITINGQSIEPESIYMSGVNFIYDCDAFALLVQNGSTLTSYSTTGNFPVLKPGANVVTGTGWSKLIFERRERFL